MEGWKPPLQGMDLQEKEPKKIKAYRKPVPKERSVTCLLILDLCHLDHKSKESILQAENSTV